jgi:cation diffusion facilitator CzcD-associated flavoprotein CzcO
VAVDEEVFDAVVVANGHYSQPMLPSVKGMEVWRRRQLHSHSYRVPDPFRGEVRPVSVPLPLLLHLNYYLL